MTAERRLHDDEGDFPSKIGAPGRSAGGANRADPIFQPSNGYMAQTFQITEKSGRFSRPA